MAREGCEREWPKCGTSKEVPAPWCQPESPCGMLPTPGRATSDLSSSIHQLQQETETWHPQGQRQALVPEPQQGQPQACRDTPELEPAQMLASIRALQLDMDFCRGMNHERLVQLQRQESTVEQRHQELVFLMQQYQAVMGKEQKDEAVQTEVTFDVAADGHADNSYNIQEKHTLLLEQGEAVPATLSQAAGLGTASQDSPQCTGEQPCQRLGEDPQQDEGCEVVAMLRALREEAACSRAEQAQSRELAEQLKAELSQWQWKHQVTLEQALQHMHAAAHATEELQRSQKQLQTLREQLGTQEEQSQGLQHHLARLQEELGVTQAREQQNLQQLSEAKETIQVLHQEVASNRKHMAELLQQVRDMSTLQAELAQAQQEKAKQEEKTATYLKQKQQLHWKLRKLQISQEQCKQEAHSLQETLQELRSQAQYWQELYKDSAQALAMREEELVVCKVDLAFLKEELSKAMEQVQVKTLRSACALACSKSGRLHKETELLLVNISQCVKEPTHSNEKLGHKIQWEIKQTAELLGEMQHVQDTLWEEDTYLMVGTDEQQPKCEQLKGNNFTLPAPHNSAGLSPPHSCPKDRKQHKTKQGSDNF